jgi:hypothetical protein
LAWLHKLKKWEDSNLKAEIWELMDKSGSYKWKVAISWGVIALSVFLVLASWWPSQESDQPSQESDQSEI